MYKGSDADEDSEIDNESSGQDAVVNLLGAVPADRW
jgi:hypothetical protein